MSEPAPRWMRWQIVGLLVAYSFMTWFNRVSMSVAYDEQIKAQSDIAPADIGFVYSAFLFFYMLCMTPGGWLIDRFGPWVALVVMGLGSALFGMLTGAAGLPMLMAAGLLYPALLVIRSLMGVLTAPIYPACSRVVANWLPVTQRASANGYIQAAAALGITCAFPMFGMLLDSMHWRYAFLVTGGVTAVLALVWLVVGANHPAPIERGEMPQGDTGREPNLAPVVDSSETGVTAARLGPRATPAGAPIVTGGTAEPPPSLDVAITPREDARWWRLLGNRSLIFLTLSYAAIGYVEYLFFFWMHYYFEDILHLGKTESRFYAAILTLAMAVGMISGGWIADALRTRFGGRCIAFVPAIGLCAGGGLMLLGVLADDTFWIVTWLALALGCVGATEAPVWTMAVELGKEYGATAAAIVNTGGNAGGLIAPVITPIISAWIVREFGVSEKLSWQWAISLGSVNAVVGAVLWYWITPHDHRVTGREQRTENTSP